VFNEQVKAGSGLIHIYRSDGTLFHSIAANDSSQVTLQRRGEIVVIDPNVSLAPGTNYYVIIEPGARAQRVSDRGRQRHAGLPLRTWSIRSCLQAPNPDPGIGVLFGPLVKIFFFCRNLGLGNEHTIIRGGTKEEEARFVGGPGRRAEKPRNECKTARTLSIDKKREPSMTRKLMAILVSSALVLGNVSTTAWSATAASSSVQTAAVQTAAVQTEAAQTVAVANNPSPLPPGGAAGIEQAQGYSISPLVGVLLVVGVVAIIYFLLHDDDEDDDHAPSTPGT